MAGTDAIARLLDRHKVTLARDIDVNKFLPRLKRKGIITKADEKEIFGKNDQNIVTETFLEVLSRKGLTAFQEFCTCLEEIAPHLLTVFLIDSPAK
ncbi:hypothetical protein KUTeg_011103 [Tegillarca granosa]|uniref:CARD domain-containing protein n=1 Tax=Tegillarca granosa TaxID=220873 RepID=A0ABQ9F2Y5_TEGGR|nr:hypothetical protein KUTeg_011103 [Tegillarca granosa]